MIKFEGARLWVAGARGMVGSALLRRLAGEGGQVLPDPARAQLDLRHEAQVAAWMEQNRPDIIFVAAARVGGILDNATSPADFIADNLRIETNIITHAARLGVRRLVFMGSSCIYPKHAPQPLREEYLMTGPLEDTNRAYAMAKLAGLELVRAHRAQHGCDFISVLPCNLYGPGDTYDEQRSHVIPALMMKLRAAIVSKAPVLSVWGTGKPLREFMHVDDLADATVHLARMYEGEGPVNIGTGEEVSIADLAHMLCGIAGYKGALEFDAGKPDGTPRKLLDVTRLSASSWRPKIPLQQGLRSVWQAYLSEHPL